MNWLLPVSSAMTLRRFAQIFAKDFALGLALVLGALVALKGGEALALSFACDDKKVSWCLAAEALRSARLAFSGAEIAVVLALPFAVALFRVRLVRRERGNGAFKFGLLSAMLTGVLLLALFIQAGAYQGRMLSQETQTMSDSDPATYDAAAKLWPHRLKMFFLTL